MKFVKDNMDTIVFVYLALMGISLMVGFLVRTIHPETCNTRYADIVFLGVTKLACPVGGK